MKIDLDSLSRAELEQLSKDVAVAIDSLAERERNAALEAVQQAAKAHGFSLEELTGPAGKVRSKTKNPAKYRNPEDPKQTWTGRGRKPQWIKAAEDAGASLSKFEI